MLPTFLQAKYISRNKYLLSVCRFLSMVLAVCYIMPVYAQTTTDNGIPGTQISTLSAETMLANIATQIPNLMQMVTALAYVMGMYFIFSGVLKLKHMGEMRTQMSYEHSLAGPLIYLAVGALLLYLPTSVQVGMSTFWTTPNPYGYLEQQDQWSEFLNVCFLIVQFIGTVAFIRGLVILSHLGGGHGGSQGAFGKGMTHIIGGIFCINIYQFVQVVMITLGIQT